MPAPDLNHPTHLDAIMARFDAITARLDAIAAKLDALGTPPPRTAPATSGAPCFPNYGRRKGEPIAGAPIDDLDYYARGCKRTLDDPAKSRWHDKERALLAAIEAEIARQGGGAPAPTGGDDAIPF